MPKSIAAVCILLLAGALAAANAATINIGYVIVFANPLDNSGSLNLLMRTNDYPNPSYPALADVKVVDAWAQLYEGANALGGPVSWDASPANPLTSDNGYLLANGFTFQLAQGITRAVISFTVDQAGPWHIRGRSDDFFPAGNLQYTAELTNGGAVLDQDSFVTLAVPGEFIPEPATSLLALPALAGLFLATSRRKKT